MDLRMAQAAGLEQGLEAELVTPGAGTPTRHPVRMTGVARPDACAVDSRFFRGTDGGTLARPQQGTVGEDAPKSTRFIGFGRLRDLSVLRKKELEHG